MNPARWERLEEIFELALSMAGETRRDFLASACSDDPTLCAEVEAMIAAHGQGVTLQIERLVTEESGADPLLGAELGPWRMLRVLGRGGMGTVYLADRADGQYQQQVALKLVGPGAVGPRSSERFRTERQLLARLQHPGIARLLDGGRAPDGRPYLVMELVDGAPITDWCRDNQSSLEQRLQLFLAACAAVQYAHEARVVHRDLKPANIFISRAAEVKLLDFGIAKVLKPDPSGQTAGFTGEGGPAMTPEYAAPEQLTGGSITATTDVYALGVVLFQLLTGEHPAGDSRQSFARLLKAIVEIPPPRMSRVVPPGRLRRKLQGDLDTIVAKALGKAPEDRYPTVRDLAEDVRLHLAGQPIHARPRSLVGRALGFVNRHRRWMSALLLIAGLSMLLPAAHRQYRAARRQEAERREQATVLADLARAGDAPVWGPPDAPVTIVVFANFDCSHCARTQKILAELMAAHPAELRVVFRHLCFAWERKSVVAAEASLAAHEQGQFWQMQDRIFAHQQHLDRAVLEDHAAALGLDVSRFRAALDSEKFRQRVIDDHYRAKKAKIEAAPAFVVNGAVIVGWPALRPAVARALEPRSTAAGKAAERGQ